MKAIFDWPRPKAVRKKKKSALHCKRLPHSPASRRAVNQKLAEMEAARKSRNFKASDALRAELTGAGIIVENTKDGVRWRRK